MSSSEKKQFLVDSFGIPEKQIFSSRDTSFLAGVLEATTGRGVDIIINFLTGDLLAATWRACADFGRFIEIGKRDILDSGRLDMTPFAKCTTFSAFDLIDIFYAGIHSATRRNIYTKLATVPVFSIICLI